MTGGFRIGRIAGIEIAVHASWLVIFFLVTYSLAVNQFPVQYAGWSRPLYWVVAGATSLLFFASVLAHELSHAWLARRFGLKVSRITLFIFGGATNLEEEPKRARDEIVIAAAGPLTSLAIGGLMFVVDASIPQPQVRALVGWLGFINISLGIFNLLPGFPMDGGRILRAILWRLRGDRTAATRNAAGVGRFFGYLLMAGGVYLALQPRGLFSGIWIALIGWFISTAAEGAAAQLTVESSLRGVTVRDVMEADPPSVGPNEPVADLVNERMLRGEHRSFVVRHEDGGLAGVVTLSDVRRLPRDNWEAARVTDIMTRYGDLATVTPETSAEDAMRLLQTREVGQLPVVEADTRTVVGLLTRTGILRLIDTRTKLGV
jgi:Zn-dependent protease